MKYLVIPLLVTVSSLSLTTFASEKVFDLRIDAKANYRNSEYKHFATGLSKFANDTGFEHATVNSGEHYELSNIAIFTKWQMSEQWQTFAKIDLIDLYERNPTSSDNEADIDNLLVRYGTKHTNGNLPESLDFYAQVGKFGKFERQEDRHLESYGLVSTAYNRLEDSGLEFGIDLSSGFYAKLSYTTGNPFFFRDPNALAGDNGVFKDPDQDIKSGMPIFYDAEIEDFDLSKNPETGVGLGYRWLNNNGNIRLNFLLFNYKRDLADTVKLQGTEYGGDLDLLEVTAAEVAGLDTPKLPFKGNNKDERGLNIWWYQNNLAVFLQYVQQDVAGLERNGKEIEVSYEFKPKSNFIAISPVIRYSTLKPDYAPGKHYPSPSVTWEWDKIDMGVNVDFNKAWRFTIERSNNYYIRAKQEKDNDEVLATLRYRYDL